jgi:hypothetical protein
MNWRDGFALAYTLIMPVWMGVFMWATNDTQGWEVAVGMYLLACVFFWTYGRDKDRKHQEFLRELEAARRSGKAEA